MRHKNVRFCIHDEPILFAKRQKKNDQSERKKENIHMCGKNKIVCIYIL